MVRFDGPQKANGFGFQPADGFKFKSAEQLSGSDKEIVVPLSSNASEAEKAKLKQQKEDAKVAEQYKVEQLKQQARKLGFSENIIELINSSDFKIDARAKTLTEKSGDTEFVYTRDRMKQSTTLYKGANDDDLKCVNEYNENGTTRIFYKKNDRGKYVKVATTYLDRQSHVKGSEFYDGNNIRKYESSATDVDVTLMSKERFNYTYGNK